MDDLVTNGTNYEEIRSHIDSTVDKEAAKEPSIIAPRSRIFPSAGAG